MSDKVKIPAGYVRINPAKDGPKREGDLGWDGVEWFATDCAGEDFQVEEYGGTWIRRVNQANTDGWIKVSDQLPERGQSVWATDGEKVWPIANTGNPDTWSISPITHWQPATIPPPPQPAKPAEEVACNEAYDAEYSADNMLKGVFRDGWLAALKWKEVNQ